MRVKNRRPSPPLSSERPRGFVLELHELEVARDEVEVREIGRPDHLRQGPPVVVVADGAVEGLVLSTSNSG